MFLMKYHEICLVLRPLCTIDSIDQNIMITPRKISAINENLHTFYCTLPWIRNEKLAIGEPRVWYVRVRYVDEFPNRHRSLGLRR